MEFPYERFLSGEIPEGTRFYTENRRDAFRHSLTESGDYIFIGIRNGVPKFLYSGHEDRTEEIWELRKGDHEVDPQGHPRDWFKVDKPLFVIPEEDLWE